MAASSNIDHLLSIKLKKKIAISFHVKGMHWRWPVHLKCCLKALKSNMKFAKDSTNNIALEMSSW